ncbi:glycosyltransferase family 4 protein [Marinobacter sp.]|uniref:MraY family glycosyltransferase n=1 Tax=Marinobacter sp. TaxID=50741 RepID=UPI00384EB10E
MDLLVWLLPSAAILSCLFTWLLRRYALTHSLIDVPNERSSHTVPTPRGGGVSVVIAFLLGVVCLAAAGLVGWPSATGFIGAGAVVALLGFLDDHGHIAARWRLLGHFAGAAWLLAWLGGLPSLVFLETPLDLGWAGHMLGAVLLVWLLNLYNFMDGIDGIASVEAVTVCLGGALAAALVGEPVIAAAPLIMAAAVAGFLVWNFPPARIFMGDAGSGFIGIMLGGMMIWSSWAAPQLFWSWLVLLGVFVVDATYTLIQRLVRGEKVYEAHRSHAYQHAARTLGGHRPVTLAAGAINLFWLLPCASLVALGWLDGLLGVFIAYTPLIILAVYFRGGNRAAQEKS